MNIHLDDQQFTAAAAGLEIDPEAQEHLDSCLGCQQQLHSLQALIDDERALLDAEAPDWNRQQQEILLRLPSTEVGRERNLRRWIRPALAAAAVVVVAVGIGIMRPQSQNGGLISGEMPVEQILADVDAVLADDSIPGFEFIDPGISDPEEIYENGTS